MHFKRKRAQSARAGCKMCKPWKKNGCAGKARNKELRVLDMRDRIERLETGGGEDVISG